MLEDDCRHSESKRWGHSLWRRRNKRTWETAREKGRREERKTGWVDEKTESQGMRSIQAALTVQMQKAERSKVKCHSIDKSFSRMFCFLFYSSLTPIQGPETQSVILHRQPVCRKQFLIAALRSRKRRHQNRIWPLTFSSYHNQSLSS